MAAETTTPMNGADIQRDDPLVALEEQLTKGYKPSLPIEGFFNVDGMPQMWLYRDIELMLTHPVVKQALSYFEGGIAGAEFWGGPDPNSTDPENDQGLPICVDEKIGRFIKEQCERFWDRGVPLLQHAYKYGWIGSENIYDDDDGVMKWDHLVNFAPRDTFLLTQDFDAIGIRVKNVRSTSVPMDLWMAGDEFPAKGMWYAHNPRYNTWYGQSQLVSAWRPWRRLAWRDGAEQVLDTAMYRFGIGWVISRYPNEDLQGPYPGAPNTTLDSQGNPRRYARDIMRQIAEQAKSGAAIGLPSKTDEHGNYQYDLQFPTTTLQGLQNLIDAVKFLGDQITQGIGVPPELLQAAETGSGYSGRRIPLEAFLSNQQQIADAFLRLFTEQVLRPLVRFNFGWDVKFNVQVKSLIRTRTKAAQGAAQPGAGGTPGAPMGPAAQHPLAAHPVAPANTKKDDEPMFSQADKKNEPPQWTPEQINDMARKAIAA